MQVGDRVRIVSSIYVSDELQPGKTGRVHYVDNDYVDVVMDDGYQMNESSEWAFIRCELEVIQ